MSAMQQSEVRRRLRDQGLRFATREDWASKLIDLYHRRCGTHPCDLPVKHAFLHVAVIADPSDLVGDERMVMRKVEQIGLARFGTGMSYTWGAFDTGRVYEGHCLNARGAHTVNDKKVPGFKAGSLNGEGHAVVLPQREWDDVTDVQVVAVASVFAAEKRAGFLTADRVLPHRTFAWKSCPGDPAVARLDDINDLFREYSRHGLPGTPPEDDMPLNPDDKKWLRDTVSDVVDARLAEFLRTAVIDIGSDGARGALGVDKIRLQKLLETTGANAVDGNKRALAAVGAVARIPGVDVEALAQALADALGEGIDIDVIVGRK